jgi:hypothetical protein
VKKGEPPARKSARSPDQTGDHLVMISKPLNAVLNGLPIVKKSDHVAILSVLEREKWLNSLTGGNKLDRCQGWLLVIEGAV